MPKLGIIVKTWKRKWFIFTNNFLYYIKYTMGQGARGMILLENLSIQEVEDLQKPNFFQLY